MAWSCQGNQMEWVGQIWQFRENKVGKVGQVVKVIGLLGTNSSLYAV